MKITPKNIFHAINSNSIDKNYSIHIFTTFLHSCLDDLKREECLKLIRKIDFKIEIIYPLIENILTTELNQNVRFLALKIIETKLDIKFKDLLQWLIFNEKSYKNEILITLLLSKFSDKDQNSVFQKKIKILLEREEKVTDIQDNSKENLAGILLNLITLKHLKQKFTNINYKIDRGYIVELDFSNFNKKITGWKYKNQIADLSEIEGIKYLKRLKKVSIFPFERTMQNDLVLKCQIQLLKSLKSLSPLILRNIVQKIILDLKKIKKMTPIIKKFEKHRITSKSKSTSLQKQLECIINLIVITYLKNRYNKVKFKIKNGLVHKLKLNNYILVKIPEPIRELTFLNDLNLDFCQIYEFPNFITSLSNIKKLSLSYNLIETLPSSLGSLKKLRFLDLSSNKIKQLPESFVNLQNLSYLNLFNNKLKN
ncbi:MAG: leucine-rich repeat domain-containing protein [Candidatus Lokiarchaeota archaeon]